MVFVSCRKPERIFAMNFNQKKDLKSAMAKVAAVNNSRAPKMGDSTDLDLAALGLAGAAAALAASRKRKTER